MANVKMNGIILSEHNLGDFDKMLTMLTPRNTAKSPVLLKVLEDLKVVFWQVRKCFALENI